MEHATEVIFATISLLISTCPWFAFARKGSVIISVGRTPPIAIADIRRPKKTPDEDFVAKPLPEPWVVIDSLGFRWDIYHDGSVEDGSNDAYDGAMQLLVNGAPIPRQTSPWIRKDGKEILIPWVLNNIVIRRRIFINKKKAYCRWVDTFKNTSSKTVSLDIKYVTNLGEAALRVQTSSGKQTLGQNDWAVVTAGVKGSAHPAIVHIFSAPEAQVKPRVAITKGNDNIYYYATLIVPPNSTAALCFFHAQRRTYDNAIAFMKNFNLPAEISLLPPKIRRILLNMRMAPTIIAGIELERTKQSDSVILRNGRRIDGTLLTKTYIIETTLGKISVPADKAVGLIRKEDSESLSRFYLLMSDGQVISGKIISPPVLTIKQASGKTVKVSLEELTQVAYRISPKKPEVIRLSCPMVILKSGSQLAIQHDSGRFEVYFLTVYGKLKLTADMISSIELENSSDGLERVVFRNGSTLTGLITPETIKLNFSLIGPTDLPCTRIKRIIFPKPKSISRDRAKNNQPQAVLQLRSGNTLYGKIADAEWLIESSSGRVKINPSQISTATFDKSILGQVEIHLHNGKTIKGVLSNNFIHFQITPGPRLKIFTGRIKSIKAQP